MYRKNQYCNSLTKYIRRKSRVVNIGDCPLGGEYPIRLQSMTTTDTMDTESTVQQSIRMIDAGCEYIRITAPSLKDAKNLQNIRDQLKNKGYKNIPLIADIHFTPSAAMEAARIVHKVRINPGNYADRKNFKEIKYTDQSYDEELERIYERFYPLVIRCKEEGCAMRIGANHGSLSDRILSRYGDTPLGMVESAMEFLRICNEHNFHEIVLSMKASNTRVMVQAYRLLVNQMDKENMDYPLHLGVTEAGEGDDGRIKSSVGIGTLLEDGLGDTVRVSLTEEPEYEIPIAKILVDRYDKRIKHNYIKKINCNPLNPFEYRKRESTCVKNMGGDNVPRIICDLSMCKNISHDNLEEIGYKYFQNEDKWGIGDFACDYIFVGDKTIDFKLPGTLSVIQNYRYWIKKKKDNHFPMLDSNEFMNGTTLHSTLNFVKIFISDLTIEFIQKINKESSVVLVISTKNNHAMAELRRSIFELIDHGCKAPVIISRFYTNISHDEFQIFSATDTGGLFIDGLGDGILIKLDNKISLENQLAFGILQASRTRISKTEYISCPSCGRTLFDLQKTTAMVRKRTNHLKGIKIGIMGCIVNGPGEMADADYGYVGTGIDKISLYRGQNVVKSNIPTQHAVDALIDLIKEDGVWIDPKEIGVIL